MSKMSVCLVFLCALAEGGSVILCTGERPNAVQSFASLDLALEAARGMETASVDLNSSTGLDVARNQALGNQLIIVGSKQLVLLKAFLTVEKQAEVLIRSVKFGLGSTIVPIAWVVDGKLTLEDCEMVGFSIGFAGVTGVFSLVNSEVRDSLDTFISIASFGADISLLETLVTNHTGNFLTVGYKPASLLVQKCKFVGNLSGKSKNFVNMAFVKTALFGTGSVADSVFEGNSIAIFGLSISLFNITFSNCTFLRNTQGAIAGSVLQSSITIVSSSWHLNGGIAINLSALNGIISLFNSTLSNQTELGFIRAVGLSPPQSISGVSPALCLVSISHSVIANATITVQGGLGLLSLQVCAGQLLDVTISRVNITAADFASISALLYCYGSLLQVSSSYIEYSGTTNPIIGTTLGQLVLRDIVIQEPYAWLDEYISTAMSVLQISNLTMICGSWARRSSYYIVLFNSQALINTFNILGNSKITHS